jgi:nucleoside 2-deoxyribosyltransferase
MVERKSRTKMVICGSVRANGNNVRSWVTLFTNLGFQIIMPANAPHPHTHDPRDKSENRKFYYEKITEADIVLVCNDVDYIGFETSCEIGYAVALGKKIWITNPDSQIDGIRAFIFDKTIIPVQDLVK